MTREVHTLDNGVTAIIDTIPHVQTASVGFYFTVGARHEDDSNNGAAHFLEHMAFKGTHNRDALQISREMEDSGAAANAFTGHNRTCYFLHGLDRDAPNFIKLLGDILENSTLPQQEIDRERGAIIQEIGGRHDDLMDVALDNARATAFPGQPLGASILGPVHNTQNMDRQALQDFRQAHYHGGNLIVSVAGNVDPAAILNDINQATANVACNQASQAQTALYHGGSHHEERDSQQLNMIMQFNASAANSRESTAEKVMSIIFGGGTSSRLFQEVREKRGLVYQVGSTVFTEEDTGLFTVLAATGEKEIKDLVPVLCSELKRIQSEPVSEDELNRARNKVQAGLARSEESVQGRMTSAAHEFHMRGQLRDKQDVLGEVNTVTAQDVQDAARRVFATAPTVSTVGPGRNVPAYSRIKHDIQP